MQPGTRMNRHGSLGGVYKQRISYVKSLYTHDSYSRLETDMLLLAPAVTVGETEGAMDSASVFFLPLLLPITL